MLKMSLDDLYKFGVITYYELIYIVGELTVVPVHPLWD